MKQAFCRSSKFSLRTLAALGHEPAPFHLGIVSSPLTLTLSLARNKMQYGLRFWLMPELERAGPSSVRRNKTSASTTPNNDQEHQIRHRNPGLPRTFRGRAAMGK